MKSGLRKLTAKTAKPPVTIGNANSILRGHGFSLGVGQGDLETMMRQYGLNGTIFAIGSLLAESSASPRWRLYRSTPVDGRRRYTTGDHGSDQRVEIVQHAAIKLWNNPNPYMTGFEFREAAQLHMELAGETFWVLDTDAGFPTSMWVVRPDRMEPLTGPNGELTGWMYTGPNGDRVPLKLDEVISERRPNPLDPYRGLGPVQAIMPNIQQQRYATEYQRNVFLNGATPSGIITFPNGVSDRELQELVERWRETHRGVARAGHIGVLEQGATWTPAGTTNRDMEYGTLRLNNRDEMREAFRIHKHMIGASDDVNRANAQTAEETFVSTQIIPRLNRRRDTLNNKLLVLFGQSGVGVEFDYDDPSPENAEAAAKELLDKSNATQFLVAAGYDRADVLEVVGLPPMGEVNTLRPTADSTVDTMTNGQRVGFFNKKDAATEVIEQEAGDFPPSAMSWMYHAQWSGPLNVPLNHINPTMNDMEGVDPNKVQKFRKRLQKGKKVDPVILVKTPGNNKLRLIEGHHRYLAYAELGQPVVGYVAVVNSDHGPWDQMHSQQKRDNNPHNEIDSAALADLLERPFTARAVGTSWNRG